MASISGLSGCAQTGATEDGTPKVYPEGPRMDTIYEQHMAEHAGGDLDARRQRLAPGDERAEPAGEAQAPSDEATDRQAPQRPSADSTPAERLTDGTAALAGYTRTAHDELETRFGRVPNPALVMYVFPHLATSSEVPVPGYSTTFPMFERDHYALPGEPEAR